MLWAMGMYGLCLNSVGNLLPRDWRVQNFGHDTFHTASKQPSVLGIARSGTQGTLGRGGHL